MANKKWILRIFRFAALAVLAVILLTFAAVQIQQRILRWRAERLMADMHQIRLYQSNWADAQRLMYRWGAWGHYNGICTAADCRYAIVLGDASFMAQQREREGNGNWLWSHHAAYVIYSLFGGRYAPIYFEFIVQDGTIWRTSTAVNIEVDPKLLDKDDLGYVLIVEAKSQQALRQSEGNGWVLGRDEQLAEHPYYKAGRPGGCELCQMARITYSTHTPQAEIEHLTSFDLSCMTRFWFHSCTTLGEVLPAAKPWHLYHDNSPNSQPQQPATLSPKPCNIPIWALARDARYVLSVNALSNKPEKMPSPDYFNTTTNKFDKEPDYDRETAQVKVVASFKGTVPWPPGTVVKAYPYSWSLDFPPFETPEHLLPGKHYIVFLVGDDRRYQGLTKESPIYLDRCGVQEDTPEVRRELEKGFAQNDNLRGPEIR